MMPASELEERATLTVEEAGRLLGLGRNSAYAAVQRGEIPVLRFGRRLLVPRAALQRLLATASVESE
jgi:excisionase family DNA binding protein